ncbi:MAG TPA: cation:proton antiporter, partial [Janthinobacterium sp.]|nr:cation:proton antiporter [Janthinobacterium sp.]
MQSILSIASDLSWPFAIALAWVAGEFGHRWTGLPRISFYGVVGFALAQAQVGILPQAGSGPVLILADVAFGLILFELGYRINLRWLANNPWIAVAGLVEAIGTFAAVYVIALEFRVTPITALLLASLAMSTSPATVMRVINEERSSGQVTERVVHLTALNCVLAVFTFNVIVGFWMFH